MKIGVHIPIIDPKVGGGYTFQQLILRSLLAEAKHSRHEFVIYTNTLDRTKSYETNERVEFAQAKNSPIRKTLNRLQDLLFERRLLHFKGAFEKDVEQRGVELVWFVTPEYLDCHVPFIFTLWDLAHVLMPWFPEVSRHGEWERREARFARVLRQATRILVINKMGRAELLSLYQIPPERIIPLPLPTPDVDQIPRQGGSIEILERHGIIRERYLFYPAQFWPHKNHINLLKALKDLQVRHKLEFTLVCVGSDQGSESHVREYAKELGIENLLKILGFVSIEELTGLYQNAFALVFPTFFGPENLPPLEAFALGCPVIASRVPGADDQLADAALLFDPTQPQELADAIQKLSQDSNLRSELITKGKARASKHRGSDYVQSVLNSIDEFEAVRRCWTHLI